MLYQDRIYEKINISESVILELINSQSLQRLKNIDQAGYHEPYFPGTSHSRFEHSIGVYLLLKKYNAPFEEQIAGLIHDVSHSAFSHCIDHVLDAGSEKEQNHQDNIFKVFVKKSEIPQILRKYNLDVDYIIDEKNFPLKEKELPDLCADRIDYSLRTAVIYDKMSQEEINYFLDNLITENNQWIFKDFESSQKYANLFFRLNSLYYAGLPTAIMFCTVKNYLRYALDKNYISEDDLYTDDNQILQKIGINLEKDEKLKLFYDKLNNKIKVKSNPNDYDSRVFCKSRVVDPLCFYNGEIKKVSEIDNNWIEVLNKESIPKEYFLKFER